MKKWSNVEINVLKTYKNKNDFKRIKTLLHNRTEKSIRHKLSRLNITNRPWSDDMVKFVVKYYPEKGLRFCAENLNLTIQQVNSKVHNLKLIRKRKKININDYNSKYGSYLLGFLWADGHIYKNSNTIMLTINEDDGKNISDIFNILTGWTEYNYSREKYGWKNVISYTITDKYFNQFLTKMDYTKKSKVSPNKILKFLNKEYEPYFYRGIIDGDGCFYHNEEKSLRQLSISSTYEQDWGYMEKICKDLNINYTIQRISKKTSYSNFRIFTKSISIFGKYIYNDFNFGLNRKYQTYLKIINSKIRTNNKVRINK